MINLKKVILICIVILIVVSIILLISIKKSNKNIQSDYWTENNTEQKYNLNTTVKENTSRYDFFAVKDCIETYYSYIDGINITLEEVIRNAKDDYDANYDYEKELKENKEMYKKAIYSCLGEEFLEEWNVNVNNIEEKIELQKNVYISIEKLYAVDSSENVSIYFAYGNNMRSEATELEPFSIMILMDMTKNTFKIYPTEYVEKYYKNISDGIKMDLKIEEIKSEAYNTFEYKVITEAELINYYIQEYNNSIIYNNARAYNLLEEEYRKKRFGSLQNFVKYLNENDKAIKRIILKQYSVQLKDGYTEYICIDNKDNYYIFREKQAMQPKLILDTYTLELPEFIEKYNSVNEREKTVLNIQKFMKAINAKDYGYAYNCLSNGFKNNYFKTQEQFEEYINNNFYENNDFAFGKFEEQSGVYTYKITIKDVNNETNEFTKTFVVKLNEGTNFELSFNV